MKSPLSSGHAGSSLDRDRGIHGNTTITRGGMMSSMIEEVELERRSRRLMWTIIVMATIGATIAIYFLR